MPSRKHQHQSTHSSPLRKASISGHVSSATTFFAFSLASKFQHVSTSWRSMVRDGHLLRTFRSLKLHPNNLGKKTSCQLRSQQEIWHKDEHDSLKLKLAINIMRYIICSHQKDVMINTGWHCVSPTTFYSLSSINPLPAVSNWDNLRPLPKSYFWSMASARVTAFEAIWRVKMANFWTSGETRWKRGFWQFEDRTLRW